MTDKVVIKTDIVTPLKETFEQKSKKKTSWGSTPSDDNYPSEKLTKDSLDTKLDKQQSNANKGKNVVVDSSTGQIAFEDKPTIPTHTSDLVNDGDGTTGVTYVKSDDTRLTDSRTPNSHTHGDISNTGAITSSAVTFSSSDVPIVADASNSGKLQKGAVPTDYVKDPTAHTNIGSSANATQSTINSSIDTALSNKADSSSLSNYVLTSKILDDIDNAVDNTQIIGAIELKSVLAEIEAGVPSGVELTEHKKNTWSATPNNTNYPTEKLVKDSLDAKLDDSQLKTSITSSSGNSDIPSAKAVYDYVASVPKWTTQVASTLSELPQTGTDGVFYLVPNSSSESQNAYDEYFWNGSSYEKFGTKTIDISNLVTMDDVLDYINSNGSLSLPTTGTDAGYLVFRVG